MTKYKNPKITISKVYTKSGDTGKTYLIGGEKVFKDDVRVVAYGSVDELIVSIATFSKSLRDIAQLKEFTYLSDRLISIQNELFNLGTVLASVGSSAVLPGTPQIEEEDITQLEKDIDTMNAKLENLTSFTLPGDSKAVLNIHLSRVVCRRVEQNVVSVLRKFRNIDLVVLQYLNRLSDYLFVLGRWISKELEIKEELWDPNNITSNK